MTKVQLEVETEYGSVTIDVYKCDNCGKQVTRDRLREQQWLRVPDFNIKTTYFERWVGGPTYGDVCSLACYGVRVVPESVVKHFAQYPAAVEPSKASPNPVQSPPKGE